MMYRVGNKLPTLRLLKSLGFVNRFGYGVQPALALLAQNVNPPAEFAFDEHVVLAKIFRRPE